VALEVHLQDPKNVNRGRWAFAGGAVAKEEYGRADVALLDAQFGSWTRKS